MRKLLFVLVPMVIVLLVTMLAVVACGNDSDNGDNSDNGAVVSNGNDSDSDSDMACATCHNDTDVISGKAAAWAETPHGSGTSRAYAGGRGGCAGCHSGGGFSAAIAAGEVPGEYEAGNPNPSGQDCRACHEIHVTGTGDDWALETTDAVNLYAFEGAVYDSGQGNLCANCHQPRRAFDGYIDGDTAEVDSTHWGPHHGPQSAVFLGIGGAGDTAGSPGAHYSMVDDGCVSCHLGEDDRHTFAPAVADCVSCHADAEGFDINGLQTEVDALTDQLKEALLAAGLLAEVTEHGATSISPVPGTYPVAQAAALWNWILIVPEDSSSGVHNPSYIKALLEDSLKAF